MEGKSVVLIYYFKLSNCLGKDATIVFTGGSFANDEATTATFSSVCTARAAAIVKVHLLFYVSIPLSMTLFLFCSPSFSLYLSLSRCVSLYLWSLLPSFFYVFQRFLPSSYLFLLSSLWISLIHYLSFFLSEL